MLEKQALCHSLKLSYTVRIPGEQLFFRINLFCVYNLLKIYRASSLLCVFSLYREKYDHRLL